MDLSVVVTVRNDPLLPNALSSVPDDVELIVAMTRPPEQTRRLAHEFKMQRPDLRIVETDKTGMSAGVNLGVTAATHEKVVLLDSDCTFAEGAVGAFSLALDRADFVRGRTFVRRTGGWSEFGGLGFEELNRTLAKRPRLIGPPIAFKKSPFLALGGYDEAALGSCDHEFVLRMEDSNIATLFESDAVLWHQPVTFRIDTRSHFGYGRGMCAIDRKRRSTYGLKICLLRWFPTTLWNKLVHRGPMSVFRSLLLGGTMLSGYICHMICNRSDARYSPRAQSQNDS